jgi:Protein of unknown function (DUF3685)
MIKYWPSLQSINLNVQVVSLFETAYLKLNRNLYNSTSRILSIDILNFKIKRELFRIILFEIEVLVLDIIELDLTVEELKILTKKIIVDLFNKSIDSFETCIQFANNNKPDYSDLYDQYLLVEHLLMYLIFGGSSPESSNSVLFDSNVPLQYVEILLDNVIIYIADKIFFYYIIKQFSLSSLLLFLLSNRLCNDTYISIRSLAAFKNNLIWQNWTSYYITQPTIAYSSRCQVWFFAEHGLECRYIYLLRKDNFKQLSKLQAMIIIYLEVQDFIFPKIRNICLLLSKILVYTLSYFLEKLCQLFSRSIAIIFRSNKLQ